MPQIAPFDGISMPQIAPFQVANVKVGQECVAHGASELHVHSEDGQLPRKDRERGKVRTG